MKVNKYLALLALTALASSNAFADGKAPASVTCSVGGYKMDSKGDLQSLDAPSFKLDLKSRNDGTGRWFAEGAIPVSDNRTTIEYSVTVAPGMSVLIKGADLLLVSMKVMKASVGADGYKIQQLGSDLNPSDRIAALSDIERIKKGELYASARLENPEIGTYKANHGQKLTTYEAFLKGVIPSGTPTEFTFGCMSVKAQ